MPDTDDGARHGAPVVGDRRHTRGASLEGLTLRDADLEPKRGIRYVDCGVSGGVWGRATASYAM